MDENEPSIFYHGEKTYILSASVDSDKIKLLCQVLYQENKIINYLGIFSFADLKKSNPYFNKCSNIENVCELIKNCVRQNMILVKDYKNYIDLIIFISNGNENVSFSFGGQNNNNFSNINPKKKRYYITLNLPLIKTNYYATNIPPIKNSNYINKNDDLNYSQSININNQTNKVNNNKSSLINEINIANNNQQKDNLVNDNIEDLKDLNVLEKEYEKVKSEIKELDETFNLANSQITNYTENNNLRNARNKYNEEWKVINQKLLKENQELKKLLNSLNNLTIEINGTNTYVKGEIFKNYEELAFICRRIGQNSNRILLNLIYKGTADTDTSITFHEKCDTVPRSLVLIETDRNLRFGGFTTCNWSGNGENKKDENAFVFSLDKLKIYDIIQGEEAIGCFPNYGPIFCCQIIINDNAFENGGTTDLKEKNYKTEEDYELNGGFEEFKIKEIEVYSVEME